MTINGTLSASATTITLDNNTWPAVASGDKLTLVIDPDTANEEIVYVTEHIVNTYDATILRGQEGTTAREHVAKKVRHMITAADLQEAHQHMANSSAVHGLAGSVVGTTDTQTLTNKTINASLNTVTNIPAANVTGLSGTYAPLASPNFSGTPTISGNAIATQSYADGKVAEPSSNGIVVRTNDNTSVARSIVSGTPSTISIAFADGVGGNPSISFIGSAAGVSSIAGTANQISASASTGAVTLSLPSTLTLPNGTVATTQTAGDNSTKVATTAYVKTAVDAVSVATHYASVYIVGGTLSTDGVLSYTSENVKTATGMHSNSTNSSRLIATTAGKYKISATVRWSRNSTDGTCQIYFTKNGTKIDGTDGANYISTTQNLQSTQIETIVTLALNDYVEVYGDVPGGSVNYNSTFNFEYVGA